MRNQSLWECIKLTKDRVTMKMKTDTLEVIQSLFPSHVIKGNSSQ
jgi:hypothetical protein